MALPHKTLHDFLTTLVQHIREENAASDFFQVGHNFVLTSQIEALSRKLKVLVQAQNPTKPIFAVVTASECSQCGAIDHTQGECLVKAYWSHQNEKVYFTGNTYNSSWKNCPNLSKRRRQRAQHSQLIPYQALQ